MCDLSSDQLDLELAGTIEFKKKRPDLHVHLTSVRPERAGDQLGSLWFDPIKSGKIMKLICGQRNIGQ